ILCVPEATVSDRYARAPRGTLPSPLRGGRSVHVRRSNASFPHWQATFVAPEGRRVVATGGAEPEAQRNPWKVARIVEPPRRGGGSAGWARRSGGARRAGCLLRPSGAVSILMPPSTGCARFARFTRGNSPPPLRGGIHVGDAFHGLRSLRSLHPWQPTSAPPGRNPCWRRFPRVALAALASPVATFLRPSGAADPCASAVQTRPFVTGKRPSSPRRG